MCGLLGQSKTALSARPLFEREHSVSEAAQAKLIPLAALLPPEEGSVLLKDFVAYY